MRIFPKITFSERGARLPNSTGGDLRAHADGVVGVLAAEVPRRFGQTVEDLQGLPDIARSRIPGASDVLRWYGLLTDAQTMLEGAEHALLGVLDQGSGPLTEEQMELAVRVDAAVMVRDNRAQVLRFLLGPDAVGKRNPVAGREALGVRRAPALSTSVPPPRPAAAPSVRGVGR